MPSAEDAIEMTSGRVCLVNGTITPCWSYDDHDELWSRKHGTTGFNAQLVSLLGGNAIYISDPLPGKTHDAAAFVGTPVAEIIRNSGGGIADKGYQGCGMVTRARSSRTASSCHGKGNSTLMSHRSGHPSKGSLPISSPGGSSIRTTAARTTPTATRMTPLAGCSSSHSTGVLNKVQCTAYLSLRTFCNADGYVLPRPPKSLPAARPLPGVLRHRLPFQHPWLLFAYPRSPADGASARAQLGCRPFHHTSSTRFR